MTPAELIRPQRRWPRRWRVGVAAVVVGVATAATAGTFLGTASAATLTATVTVNAGQGIATFSAAQVGANVAIWDGMLADPQTSTLLKNAAVSFVRYPGGSYGDIYHWQTNTAPGGYVAPNTDFDQYMTMVKSAGAQPIIIANYGSGTPQEAADWVRYANVTKGYGVKYWEIGNEVYGNGHYGADWETDNHSDKSPRAYATNLLQYASAMKAVDPTIKIGVVLTTPTYWPDGIVGSGDSADWNDTVMSVVKNSADFGIFHYYPGGTSEADQLTKPAQLTSIVSQFKADMARYATNNPGVFITEVNSGAPPSDTQMQALFAADMYLTAAESGVTNTDWWNVRNGVGATSTDVTGTTDYGDGGFISSGAGAEPPAGTPFATYYGIQMVNRVAGAGDTLVRASSSNALLAVHAAKRANGNLDVLLLNKDPNNSYQVNLSYSGYSPAAGVTIDSFTNRGTSIVTSTQGSASSQAIPPYSLVTVHLRPAGSSQSPSSPSASSKPPSSPPASSQPPSSPPASSRPPSSRPPSSAPPSISRPPVTSCTATYRTVSSWPGGYQGEVTVTAGSAAAINGWTNTWTLASGQTISQIWSGTLTTSGSAVTVRNVSWNGALSAGTSAVYGFIGSGTSSSPTITCTSP